MKKTNWDDYYNRPSVFSKFTRLYTERWLIRTISNIKKTKISIAELGGGNSCFHDAILKKFNVCKYTIYDNNLVSIKKFQEKYYPNTISNSINCDLLKDKIIKNNDFDIVFSVGLIEHFDYNGTKEVIKKHFNILKPDGIVIITAPTPTILYNIIRRCAEILGVWKFHDERPLFPQEIHDNITEFGEIIDKKYLWAIGLTQYAVVVKTN